MYKIDKSVPVPFGSPSVPFDEMEPGDSVLIPTGDATRRDVTNLIAYQNRSSKSQRHYVSRPDDGGTRIWRVK